MDIAVFPDNRLILGTLKLRCALGATGITAAKREGDKATPAGRFALRRVLYRADRLAAPRTALPVAPIGTGDGWCDAPGDPQYNKPVTLPYAASHERLWREDHLYDIVVVLGYNDAPPVAGKGSAIFMHVARPGYAPTEGCVALALADLEAVLARCGPGDCIHIHAGTAED
ncbi:MAG: L,D-transpeptidase family protein [Alphaproteobacteria bacterium]|nr:L,D-transpeptidase family protein [Alphaproteobacteria bacterium]